MGREEGTGKKWSKEMRMGRWRAFKNGNFTQHAKELEFYPEGQRQTLNTCKQESRGVSFMFCKDALTVKKIDYREINSVGRVTS